MRWLGHVWRMNNTIFPKQVLFGELPCGKRDTGRPKLRYKDVWKKTLEELPKLKRLYVTCVLQKKS